MKPIRSILVLASLAAGAAAQQQAVLHAGDGESRDWFGRSVSISGGTILLGASLDNNTNNDQGSAYVFVASGAAWSQQAKLVPLDMQTNAYFGTAVSLSGESGAVGSPNSFLGAQGTYQGAAYVFLRNGSSWAQQAKLFASDAAGGDLFGSALALDGNTLAVGAPRRDDSGAEAGGVYVFVRSGSVWSQQAKLLAGDGAAGDQFGTSVALAGDTLVVGAPRDDGTGIDSGSAYVFVRSGTSWSQQSKLVAADALGGDGFGRSVALAGETLVAGASLRDQHGLDSGVAYVFGRTGTAWNQQAKLAPGNGSAFAYFGNAVAIESGTILVGACQAPASGPNSGSAYVYVGGGTTWYQAGTLTPAAGAPGDFFGTSVALSGATAAVGGPSNDDVGYNAGSAYAFWVSPPGSPFCAGDGSLATACPCANTGMPGRGCENSSATGGARLVSGGAASLAFDSVVLTSTGELPSALSIFLQGTSSLNAGTLFGDGVRCVDGVLKRIGITSSSGGVASYPGAGDPSVSASSAALGDVIAPGSVRFYQTYYRDPDLAFCPNPPGDSWNVSSGQIISWWP